MTSAGADTVRTIRSSTVAGSPAKPRSTTVAWTEAVGGGRLHPLRLAAVREFQADNDVVGLS